jgi:hypothetical protein
MKYDIQAEPIAGFSAQAAAEGQNVMMLVKGFFTPDDGHMFYRMLDAVDAHFLGPYREIGQSVSMIDHCLVLLGPDGQATVYVNHLPIMITMMARRSMQAGEEVKRSDIGPIKEVNVGDIVLPPDKAVLFYFSVRWRRGIYVNFMPLQGEPEGNLNRVLGQAFEKLWFAELLSIPGNLWPRIFSLGWFPFISLIGGPFEELLGFLDRDIAHVWEEKITARYDEPTLNTMLESWRKVRLLEEHIAFLERGVERYLAGDYLSAVGNIWPRIEGILRFIYAGPEQKPGQRALLADMRKVLEEKVVVPETYMSSLFGEYLLAFYYRDFALQPGEPVDLSRHSHAHGVAAPETYDRKKALLALLIVQQLVHYIKIGWEQLGVTSA